MKSQMLAAYLMVAAACGNKASDEAVAAYRTAQRAAQDRLRTIQTAFESAIAEVQDGKWVPRPDLGACSTTLPTPPSDTESAASFPGWFTFKSEDVVGWNSVSARVFSQPRLSIGDPDGAYLPDADRIAGETKRVSAFVPFKTDIMVLHVDEVVLPKNLGANRFEVGSETGRAWVWSPSTQKIVCASTFVGVTPESVTARIYQSEDLGQAINSQLMLAQRRVSERSAVATLAAAGAPTDR